MWNNRLLHCLGVLTVFTQLHCISGVLESIPNSLEASIARVSTALEYRVCQREVNLKNADRADLWAASLAWDSLISTAHSGVKEIYDQISTILDVLQNDKKLDKTWRKLNIGALHAILTICNGLEDRLTTLLKRFDGAELAVIDEAIGSLTAVNNLDCDCACSIPKRNHDLIVNTVQQLTECVAELENAVKLALKVACDSLIEISNHVHKAGTRISDTEILLGTSITLAYTRVNLGTSAIIDNAIQAGSVILKDARICLRENS